MDPEDLNQVLTGDCLRLMQEIPDGSIDMVLCDLPYGQTENAWDKSIELALLWDDYKRIVKPEGAILLFGQGMFTAQLMMSNPRMWRYNLIWDKQLVSGFLNANRQPLRRHEDILVFYRTLPVFTPQMTSGKKCHGRGNKEDRVSHNYQGVKNLRTPRGHQKMPTSIISIRRDPPSKHDHPTQKPVRLCEYLIKTYSKPGDVVLDNCCGTGSILVAAKRLGWFFIGIELLEDYAAIARNKVEVARQHQVKSWW